MYIAHARVRATVYTHACAVMRAFSALAGAAVLLAASARARPLAAAGAPPAVPPPCACREQQYCKPLATPPPKHELFPFVAGLLTQGEEGVPGVPQDP
jgi:hypothetical protein